MKRKRNPCGRLAARPGGRGIIRPHPEYNLRNAPEPHGPPREPRYYGSDRALPKVRCIIHLKSQGAGIPDGGLFTLDQFPKRDAEPRAGQLPNVGAVEVKPIIAELAQTIAGEQVLKYVLRYGQVLVTNYREFVLMVRTRGGNAKRADSFSLAPTPEAFRRLAAHPRKAAAERGSRLVEFLTRVLRNRAVLTEPEDVAWFLASHARDAMDAVGHHSLPTLEAVRAAFEEALGIRFEGEKGDHFFRSGPMFPRPSGSTPWAATRSSKSG